MIGALTKGSVVLRCKRETKDLGDLVNGRGM